MTENTDICTHVYAPPPDQQNRINTAKQYRHVSKSKKLSYKLQADRNLANNSHPSATPPTYDTPDTLNRNNRKKHHTKQTGQIATSTQQTTPSISKIPP